MSIVPRFDSEQLSEINKIIRYLEDSNVVILYNDKKYRVYHECLPKEDFKEKATISSSKSSKFKFIEFNEKDVRMFKWAKIIEQRFKKCSCAFKEKALTDLREKDPSKKMAGASYYASFVDDIYKVKLPEPTPKGATSQSKFFS